MRSVIVFDVPSQGRLNLGPRLASLPFLSSVSIHGGSVIVIGDVDEDLNQDKSWEHLFLPGLRKEWRLHQFQVILKTVKAAAAQPKHEARFWLRYRIEYKVELSIDYAVS